MNMKNMHFWSLDSILDRGNTQTHSFCLFVHKNSGNFYVAGFFYRVALKKKNIRCIYSILLMKNNVTLFIDARAIYIRFNLIIILSMWHFHCFRVCVCVPTINI